MTRRRALLTIGVAILAASWCSAATAALLQPGPLLQPAATASASARVSLKVGFGENARLGTSRTMSLTVHVDPGLAPVTEFRVLTPAGVTLVSSQLGAASCQRPAADIMRVIVPITPQPCPANSLIGTGNVTADMQVSDAKQLSGAAHVELHTGASIDDKPGLLLLANVYNPVRMRLTYAGYLYVPPPAFGVGLAIKVPPIRNPPFGIPVALSTLHLAVGARGIVYHREVRGRRVAYRPGGVPLPYSCPRKGLRFRAILRFADASRRSVDTIVPCPQPRRGARGARA